MFIDWLTIEQDHFYEIPMEIKSKIFDFGVLGIDLKTGEVQEGVITGKYRHQGSYCDVVSIHIRGSVIKMEGNPSRWNRVENVVGFSSIDSCVACFNKILFKLGLPTFTRCSKVWYLQSSENDKNGKVTDGAVIKRIDITDNFCVGKGNEEIFLKALSQLRYRNSKARLHTDGCTVDWLSDLGNASLIYPSVYIKHREMMLHSFKKLQNKLGNTEQFFYFKKVVEYCENNGVIRFEQKLKSRFLSRNNLNYWGLSDFSKLNDIQQEFLKIVEVLKVSKVEVETIAEQLLRLKVVPTERVAINTANYASKWFSGSFGEEGLKLKSSQFKVIRARLRKVGIDIAFPCDIEKRVAVNVIDCRNVVLQPFVIPDFYRKPSNGLALLKVA